MTHNQACHRPLQLLAISFLVMFIAMTWVLAAKPASIYCRALCLPCTFPQRNLHYRCENGRYRPVLDDETIPHIFRALARINDARDGWPYWVFQSGLFIFSLADTVDDVVGVIAPAQNLIELDCWGMRGHL